MFCVLAILALAAPTFAQKLPAPRLTDVYAVDLSGEIAMIGYCLFLKWEPVDGAERYAIRITRKGGTPKYTDNWDSVRQWTPGGKWTFIDENPFYTQKYPVSSQACGLEAGQRLRARVRAVDIDSGQPVNGRASKVYAIKLPRFDSAPFNATTNWPTVVVKGLN